MCMVGGCGAWWVGVVHGGWVWCMVGGCDAWWVGVVHGAEPNLHAEKREVG